MKIIFPNIVASVRVLTGAVAFMIFILVAAIQHVELKLMFFFGLITYFLFYLLGSVVSRLIAQIDKEVELTPIESDGGKEKKERTLAQELDFLQGAELPTFD